MRKKARNSGNKWRMLLAGAMVLTLLTACGGHRHEPSQYWVGDLKHHWQECECGEPVNKGAHALKDGAQCTVCRGEVIDWGDGSGQFMTCDDQGNTLLCIAYASDGSRELTQMYEYTGDGRMRETEYMADVLTARREYATNAEGWQDLVSDIAYNEDGSFTVCQYDTHGNETLEGSYTADGKAQSETRYENEYDADGNRTLRRTFVDEVLTQEMEFLFGTDEDGSWSRSGKTTTYHEDGSRTVEDADYENNLWSTQITYAADDSVTEELRYVYEYDRDGESIGSKGYRNGKLFQEVKGIKNARGESVGITYIDYNEDGSKEVREYNDVFDLVKETSYDAAGNVVKKTAE